MIFEELHRIGQAFVADPFAYRPTDLCPRDEVLAPEKIVALVATNPDDWEDYHAPGWGQGAIAGHTLQRCWVPWSVDFADRISGVCYYALARDPELFWSLGDVAGDCPIAIYEWLSEHLGEVFAVTTTLLMYHGDASDVIYAVSCGPSTVATPMHYGGTLDQMLAANAYTLGSGLLLALAMERAGRWRSAAVAQALRHVRRERGAGALGAQFAHIPAEFLALYVQNGGVPAPLNYPSLYAAAGARPCALPLRRLFAEVDGLCDAPYPYLQYVSPDQRLCQVTSPLAASLPHLRMPAAPAAVADARARGTLAHVLFNPAPEYAEDFAGLRAHLFLGGADDEDDGSDAEAGAAGSDAPATAAATPAGPAAAAAPRADFYVMDVAGRVMAIVTQRASWAWWNAGDNAETLARSFARAGFATPGDAMDYVARRLFALHEDDYGGRRARLRAVLKTWMLALDPGGDALFGWLLKYVFGRDLRRRMRRRLFGAATAFGDARAAFWNPAPPLGFLHDLLGHFGARFPLYEDRAVSLLTNHRELVAELIGDRCEILEVQELAAEEPKRYRFRLRLRLYRALKACAADTPEARFVAQIDARVARRLATLRRAFGAREGAEAVIEHLVKDYWRRHRIDLALPAPREA